MICLIVCQGGGGGAHTLLTPSSHLPPHLKQLALAHARVSDHHNMDIPPGGDAVDLAHTLPHTCTPQGGRERENLSGGDTRGAHHSTQYYTHFHTNLRTAPAAGLP